MTVHFYFNTGKERSRRPVVTHRGFAHLPFFRKFLDCDPKSVVSSGHPASARGTYAHRHDT